ncbi:MAG: lysophospholipid acyltransferase family protein [Bacteroidales bacterium]|nr:lysophospholipid acyltransferase family protein [Bacteroidales bacterium]MCF8457157.1 lysophospholipid acyltransferase family protein [Bacteroidales bacterium]
MIKAQHTRFHVRFFEWYSKFMLNRHFQRISINGDIPRKDMSILLIGNHFSWWDGFIANYLNATLWQRKFHVMMLKEQLSQRMFLSKAGCFSIEPGRRDIVESLNYSRDILSNPENLLVMYPQGKIESMHTKQFHFSKGIERIIPENSNIQIIMYVALVDYFSSSKPSLTIYLNEFVGGEMNSQELENSFNHYYNWAVQNQKE